MKHSIYITVLVALICACLAQIINGLPQAGRGWHSNTNTTNTYNNRWQQKAHEVRGPSQNPQVNWQANGGGNWLSNTTTGNRNNYNNPKNYNTNSNWQSNNGTHQPVGGSYQREAERSWQNNNNNSHPYFQVPGLGNRQLQSQPQPQQPYGRVLLGNNQSHPYFQVPGLGDRRPFPTTTEQPNRNIGGTAASFPVGWRYPQQNSSSYGGSGGGGNVRQQIQGHIPQSNNWGSQRFNSSNQNIQTTTSQPFRNNAWLGGNTWNSAGPSNNNTSNVQNVDPNAHGYGNNNPRSNSGWNSPANPSANSTWSGTNDGGHFPSSSQSSNHYPQNQWNYNGNSQPNWNAFLPDRNLVAGPTDKQNAFDGKGAPALAPISGDGRTPALAPLAGGDGGGGGGASGHQLTNSNGLIAQPSWNPGSTLFGFAGSAQPVVSGGGGASGSGTPLAPLAGGSSGNSYGPQAGLSYSSGGQRQAPSSYPGYSNPYANLFIV